MASTRGTTCGCSSALRLMLVLLGAVLVPVRFELEEEREEETWREGEARCRRAASSPMGESSLSSIDRSQA